MIALQGIRSTRGSNSNLLLAVAALFLSVCHVEVTATSFNDDIRKTDTRPNILLIVADDLGFSDLGSYGSEIATPNLDTLAKKGVRLTSFYAAPTCSPSRAMLLSGVDNHLAGLGAMHEYMPPFVKGQPGYEGYLNFDIAALPELLRDAGYHTYMAGKWHLGLSGDTNPSARGFDKSFALLEGGAFHFNDWSYADPKLRGKEGAIYTENGKPAQLPKKFYSSRFYTDKTIDYIDANTGDGSPFFAYLALTAPHWPLQAPEAMITKYRGDYDAGYGALYRHRLRRMMELGIITEATGALPVAAGDSPWDSLTEEQRQFEARKMEVYAAMIDDMDQNIGRLIQYLKSIGQYDNTLLIFLSDNGTAGNDIEKTVKGLKAWRQKCCDNRLENLGNADSFIWLGANWAKVSSAPLRNWKSSTAEGGIRVPAIIHFPKMITNTGIKATFTTVKDIMPTLLDVAKVQHPGVHYKGRAVHPLQGESMWPMLTGATESVHEPDYMMGWELFGRRAIRQGDWKLRWEPAPFGGKTWQLYNITTDPGETSDLIHSNPLKTAELKRLWGAYTNENAVLLQIEADERQH